MNHLEVWVTFRGSVSDSGGPGRVLINTVTKKNIWRFLKKLGIKLQYDPAIPRLDIHPEKIIIQKEHAPQMFIAALFKIARTWKQPRCPWTDEWIKKM